MFRHHHGTLGFQRGFPLIALIVLALTAGAAHAAKGGKVSITSVKVDPVAHLITINGSNFSVGGNDNDQGHGKGKGAGGIAVSLGDTPLTVVDSSSTSITA